MCVIALLSLGEPITTLIGHFGLQPATYMAYVGQYEQYTDALHLTNSSFHEKIIFILP